MTQQTGGMFRRQLKQKAPPGQAHYLQPISNSSSASSLPTSPSAAETPATPTSTITSPIYGSHPTKTPKTAVFVEKYGDFFPTPGPSLFGKIPRANRHERFQSTSGESAPGTPIGGAGPVGGEEMVEEVVEEEVEEEVDDDDDDDPPRQGLARLVEIILFPLTLPALLFSSLNSKAAANALIVVLVVSFSYLAFLISQSPAARMHAGINRPFENPSSVSNSEELKRLEKKVEQELKNQQMSHSELERRIKDLETHDYASLISALQARQGNGYSPDLERRIKDLEDQDYTPLFSSLTSRLDSLKGQFDILNSRFDGNFDLVLQRIQNLEKEITFLKDGQELFPWYKESEQLVSQLKLIQEKLAIETQGLDKISTIKRIKATIDDLKVEKIDLTSNLKDMLVDAFFHKKNLDSIRPAILAHVSLDQIHKYIDDSVRVNFESKLENLRADFQSKIDSLPVGSSKEEQAKLIKEHQEQYSSLLKEFNQKIQEKFEALKGSSGTILPIDEGLVSQQIDKKLRDFFADHTGKPDYALHSGGGRILPQLTSATYHHPTTLVGSLLNYGIPSEPPVTAIQSSNERGKCWPMKGQHGTLGVQLSQVITPTAFSLEHIPKQIATWIESAPKEVEVWGRRFNEDKNAKVEEVLLARFTYDIEGPPIQTFNSEKTDIQVQVVQLRVLSNHGKEEFTCLYRFRVHGEHSKHQKESEKTS